jgi:hypothetical protein
MPRRKGSSKNNNNNGNSQGPYSPQRTGQILNLTKFQPARRIVVATQATFASSVSQLAFDFTNSTPPSGSTEISAVKSFRESFQDIRVESILVCFDQRGRLSQASQPRLTAFVLNKGSSTIDVTKLTDPARFAGSGLNTLVPGKPFRIPVGPKFTAGRFDGVGANSLILVALDYEGTARIHTTFEVLGPPIDLAAAPFDADEI